MALADLIAPYRICSFVKVYSQLFQTLLEDTFNFDELSETRPPQPSSGHQSIIKVAEVYVHVIRGAAKKKNVFFGISFPNVGGVGG